MIFASRWCTIWTPGETEVIPVYSDDTGSSLICLHCLHIIVTSSAPYSGYFCLCSRQQPCSFDVSLPSLLTLSTIIGLQGPQHNFPVILCLDCWRVGIWLYCASFPESGGVGDSVTYFSTFLRKHIVALCSSGVWSVHQLLTHKNSPNSGPCRHAASGPFKLPPLSTHQYMAVDPGSAYHF